MNDPGPRSLEEFPVHLGVGAVAVPQPVFTGDLDWYEGYAERHADDGVEGRLVSQHTFDADWDTWEMHPNGTELVLVTAGVLRLIQDDGESTTSLQLGAGQYAINAPGVWHTADVVGEPVTVIFVTAGAGTQHRLR